MPAILGWVLQILAMYATPQRIASLIRKMHAMAAPDREITSHRLADAMVSLSSLVDQARDIMDPVAKTKILQALDELSPKLKGHVDRGDRLMDRIES